MSFEAVGKTAIAPESIVVRRAVGSKHRTRLGDVSKRSMDVTLAATVLLLLFPLLVLITLAIWASGSSIIYAHRRVGHKGRAFSCYKFRTMLPDAESVLAANLAENPIAALEWRDTRKLKYDPRVTRIGRILRETSLDELPQLFNVLKGDMSCVGPRPIVFAELQRYGAVARDYFAVRPGLTGLWQVSGRNSLSYDERVSLDRHYIRNRSFLFDVSIMLRTVPAVMRRTETS